MEIEKKKKTGLFKFLQKLDKRWNKLRSPSKVLFVVAILEELFMVIVGILKLVIPREACFDQSNELYVCPEYYMVDQSFATFAWNVFFFISIFHGLFYGNIYELYAAMLLACCMTSWSIWRFIEPYPNKYLDYLFLISTCLSQLVYFGLSPLLYNEYAWVIYRKAGAEEHVCEMYRKYLQWSCFQKLDAFFGLFSILLSGKGLYNVEWIAALDWSMFVLVLIFLGIGYYAVRKEIVYLTIIWFFLFPILPAYVIFNIIHDTMNNANYTDKVLHVLFRVCGTLFLIARICLTIFTIIVFRNYGKGLLQLKQDKKTSIKEEESGEYYESTEGNDWPLNHNTTEEEHEI